MIPSCYVKYILSKMLTQTKILPKFSDFFQITKNQSSINIIIFKKLMDLCCSYIKNLIIICCIKNQHSMNFAKKTELSSFGTMDLKMLSRNDTYRKKRYKNVPCLLFNFNLNLHFRHTIFGLYIQIFFYMMVLCL